MGRIFVRALPQPAVADPSLPIEWDDTPCPLCGRDDARLILEAADPNPAPDAPALRFPVVRCGHCSLTYTNPRPAPASIGHFYPAHYRPHREPRIKPPGGRWRSWLAGSPAPERTPLPWHGRGRLLDFGCGGGAFLRRMADEGWEVTGLDSSPEAVRRVRDGLGLRALQGTLPHPDLVPGGFDVVTLWHSLEHVHRPLDVLREVFQLLAPGGRVVVACPNVGGWPARWFGPSWFGLDLPRHLTHFCPATLTTMLAAAGFRVESVRGVRHSDWVRSSAKLAARRGGGFWAKALTRKPAAKAAALLASLAGRSDCVMAVGERPGP